MKILKIKLFQETACYKKPFAFKVAETYPLPPYSTVIGMFHKIIGAKSGELFPMNISIQGEFESIFSNYQTLRKYKEKEVTTLPMNVHQLLNVNLIIHVKAEDDVIQKIYQNIINGQDSFTLGRNEDLVRVDEVKIINKIKEIPEEEINLKHNIYIPNNLEEDIEGINYRLNTTYTIENNLRKWKKVDVKYIEKNTNELISKAFVDDDGDIMMFYKKED